MNKREQTSALVDGILRLAVGGAFIGSSLLIPNMAVALDKPFNLFMKGLDKRAKEREITRALRYMRREQLINGQTYEHGITLTKKGLKRLKDSEFNNLSIGKPKKWDGKWRLVIFDIPEKYKTGRNSLSFKLKLLGFKPLQRSVWVHPFACHKEIEIVAVRYKITDYVTYLETSYIDKPDILKAKFDHLLK